MKFQTTRFGEIDVADENKIVFPNGMLGFETCHNFVIIPHPGGGPLEWLQSLEHGHLAFVICSPQVVIADYNLSVQIDELGPIEVVSLEEAEVKVIMRVPPAPQKPTVNLMGPIFLNGAKHLGMQYVVNNSKWSCRHELEA